MSIGCAIDGTLRLTQTDNTETRFIDLQTDLMVRKARSAGGGLVDLSAEENIDIMIQVMSDMNLHLQAAAGYKKTGTTVALDGSEDNMICTGGQGLLGRAGNEKPHQLRGGGG